MAKQRGKIEIIHLKTSQDNNLETERFRNRITIHITVEVDLTFTGKVFFSCLVT